MLFFSWPVVGVVYCCGLWVLCGGVEVVGCLRGWCLVGRCWLVGFFWLVLHILGNPY